MNLTSSAQPGVFTMLLTNLIHMFLQTSDSITPNYPTSIEPNRLLNSYDFIVIGAGSAGSPLAASLSKDPSQKVLLIEAGGIPPIESEIPALFHTIHGVDRYDWNYKTVPQPKAGLGLNEFQSVWVRGKMLGGSSAINAMIYQRGQPEDYNNWERLGNHGWGYEDIKRYFDEQESTEPHNVLEKFKSYLIKGIGELGYEDIRDPLVRSQGPLGYVETLLTVKDGKRNSAARMFLESARNRSNLHVLLETTVTKLEIDGTSKRIKTVEAQTRDGQKLSIKVDKEVIMSAGSINTPQILMLSGIGPKTQLNEFKIPIIADLPVGEHLQDHSNVLLFLKTDDDPDLNLTETMNMELLKFMTNQENFFSTNGPLTQILGFIDTENGTKPNVQFHFTLFPRNQPDLDRILVKWNIKWKYIEELVRVNEQNPVLMVFLHVLRPNSMGNIRLKSKSPFDYPLIDPKYNTDPRDVNVILGGIQHLERLIKTKSLRQLNPQFIKFDLKNCDGNYWECYAYHFTSTIFHPTGTAIMGEDGVVDDRLKVRSVEGLRVADASIIPKIISGNTNAACMMIGQKAADLIAEDWRLFENQKDEL